MCNLGDTGVLAVVKNFKLKLENGQKQLKKKLIFNSNKFSVEKIAEIYDNLRHV